MLIEDIFKDIRKALESDCFLAALALALTLPDICGKAEYPNLNSVQRYIKWYDEYIGITERPPKASLSEPDLPYLSGEVIYQLRCAFLHQGSSELCLDRIKNKFNKITEFHLIRTKNPHRIAEDGTDMAVYGDSSCLSEGFDGKQIRKYNVSIPRLCKILCACAEGYYKDKRENFDFLHLSVSDEELY